MSDKAEAPQWFMMDSLFDVKTRQFVDIEKDRHGYIRGEIGEHVVFRVDFAEGTYSPELAEHVYSQILTAAEHMGVDKEKVVIFPSNIDVCRFVPCDDDMAVVLESGTNSPDNPESPEVN